MAQQQQQQQSMSGEISQLEQDEGTAAPSASTAAPGEMQCWTPTYIPLPVVDEKETLSRGEEVLMTINLVDFIGKGSRHSKTDVSARHYLSSSFSYNSANFRKLQLSPLFQKACAKAGFDIVSKGWEEHRKLCRFACQKTRIFQSKAKTNDGTANKPTRKPRQIHRSLSHICPFNFSVFWEAGNRPGSGRWYICACGIGKAVHEDHPPKPYQEEQPKIAPHDVAFQQLMPQYQQLCILASKGDMDQINYAGKLLQDDIYKLQAKAAPKKRKRGRPKAAKVVKFESLQGVTLPYASLLPSSLSPQAPAAAAESSSKKKKAAPAPAPPVVPFMNVPPMNHPFMPGASIPPPMMQHRPPYMMPPGVPMPPFPGGLTPMAVAQGKGPTLAIAAAIAAPKNLPPGVTPMAAAQGKLEAEKAPADDKSQKPAAEQADNGSENVSPSTSK